MQNLTIQLPDTAYRAALTFTPQEQTRLAAIMFTTAEALDTFAGNGDRSDAETETDAERAARFAELEEADIQAVGRGLADLEAGRTVPGDVVFAQMREQARNGLK